MFWIIPEHSKHICQPIWVRFSDSLSVTDRYIHRYTDRTINLRFQQTIGLCGLKRVKKQIYIILPYWKLWRSTKLVTNQLMLFFCVSNSLSNVSQNMQRKGTNCLLKRIWQTKITFPGNSITKNPRQIIKYCVLYVLSFFKYITHMRNVTNKLLKRM